MYLHITTLIINLQTLDKRWFLSTIHTKTLKNSSIFFSSVPPSHSRDIKQQNYPDPKVWHYAHHLYIVIRYQA